MRFLIYILATGDPIRIDRASKIEDVQHVLPDTLGALSYPTGEIGDVYVVDGVITDRAELTQEPSATSIASGDAVSWSGLPEGAAVFVDGICIGGVEADGGFTLTPQHPGDYVVRIENGPGFKAREWTINAT